MVERYNRRSTVGTKPTDASVDSILTEIDTEDRYRYNQYGRWEFVPPISLKNKRIQTLFCPISDQTGLIFGDGSWQNITAELHNSGCMIYKTRTSASIFDTPDPSGSAGMIILNDYAQVELLPKIQAIFSFDEFSTNSAAFIGLKNDSMSILTTTAAFIPDNTAVIGLGYRPSDTSLFVFHNDSSGVVNAIDTTIIRDNSVYMLEIEYETSTSVRLSLFDINVALVFEDTYTTEIPGSSIDLAFIARIQNVNASARYGINIFDYVRLEKTRPPLSATTDF